MRKLKNCQIPHYYDLWPAEMWAGIPFRPESSKHQDVWEKPPETFNTRASNPSAVSGSVSHHGNSSSPWRFQRWPRIDRLVTAFLEIREAVGVISTWMDRVPSLLDFRVALWRDDLMAFPTWETSTTEDNSLYVAMHTDLLRYILQISGVKMHRCINDNSMHYWIFH